MRLLALLGGVALSTGQVPTSCTFRTPTGASVSLSSLNNPAGNKVSTPLGNAVINPCTKVTLCDAMQPGSTCCVQVNDTAHPGTARWISCGKTPIYATLGGVGTSMGVILQEGPDCGYVFAPNQKVQASISFKCDRSATGFGRVAADTTAFMKQAAAVGGAGASYAPGGASKGPRFEPSLFCNLNFTWSTSLVCGLPIPAANRGSSWGWAVILVLLGVGAAYFGGGAYMNSKQPGADASMFNNIPNKEFWDGIPEMCSDGMKFVTSGGQSQHYSQYASVGEASIGDAAPKKKKKKKAAKKVEAEVEEGLPIESADGDGGGGGGDEFVE